MMRRGRELLGPAIGLALVLGLFCALAPESFPTGENLRTLLLQAVLVAVGAVGMTFVIVSGGIDLSVGSVIALASVVTALVTRAGGGDALALLAGVATGALAGMANGLLVGALRITPFIATLGTMGMARGLAKGLADERAVYPGSEDWSSMLMARAPDPPWLVLAPGVWIAIALALVAAFLLRRTVFGTWIYAVGSSEPTARLCGVPVARTKFSVYLLCGLCAGLAGALQFHRLGAGDPTTAMGKELDIVAAVVVGGAALAGGEGGIAGSMIGALLMAALANGANLVEVPALGIASIPGWVQEIAVGAIIVVAVWSDRRRRRAQPS
ncbi:MAG: ABC transporter permease [Phycisphaerales bacterium]